MAGDPLSESANVPSMPSGSKMCFRNNRPQTADELRLVRAQGERHYGLVVARTNCAVVVAAMRQLVRRGEGQVLDLTAERVTALEGGRVQSRLALSVTGAADATRKPFPADHRSSERRRHLVEYLRYHPEELRPVERLAQDSVPQHLVKSQACRTLHDPARGSRPIR